MPAVALITDLIFATKVKSTADAVGVPLSIVRSPAALEQAHAAGATLVILDLDAQNVDVIDVIRRCKSDGIRATESQTTTGSDDTTTTLDGATADHDDTTAALDDTTTTTPDETTAAPMVIAYGSHVQRDLLQAAHDAGADLVLPRSKFSADLPTLLAEYGRTPDRP